MVEYRIKRIYEPVANDDGYRILVDRLWPRGVSKDKAALDLWCRVIAPSDELRHWFRHVPERFDEFRIRYIVELDENPAVAEVRAIGAHESVVTLLYSAHDERCNQAVVLQGYLQK